MGKGDAGIKDEAKGQADAERLGSETPSPAENARADLS